MRGYCVITGPDTAGSLGEGLTVGTAGSMPSGVQGASDRIDLGARLGPLLTACNGVTTRGVRAAHVTHRGARRPATTPGRRAWRPRAAAPRRARRGRWRRDEPSLGPQSASGGLRRAVPPPIARARLPAMALTLAFAIGTMVPTPAAAADAAAARRLPRMPTWPGGPGSWRPTGTAPASRRSSRRSRVPTARR